MRRLRSRLVTTARVLTAPARPTPDVVIIGAQRCGTTTIFEWLSQSPRARPSRRKELHWFDDHADRSIWWYRSHFPLRHGGVAFEATPSLLYLEDVPERFARALPEARVVVSLRDPVARAISGYWHTVRYGGEHRPLEEAIWSAPTSLHDAYKERGRYAEQLRRWREAIGPERITVVFFEELVADPAGVVGGLAAELGLGPLPVAKVIHANRQDYPPREVAGLRSYFASPDAALRELLGRELPWSTAASTARR